jgi:hypothetical protein
VAGRACGSSSTAGLSLDGEDLSFDLRCRDLKCEESKYGGGFYKTTFVLRVRHLFRAGGSTSVSAWRGDASWLVWTVVA